MGSPVVIRSHGSRAMELSDAVADVWRDCSADAEDPREPVVVECFLDDDPDAVRQAGHRGLVADVSLDLLLDALSPRVTDRVMRGRAGELVMLHACGLADPATGSTIALVAPSGTGKSTIARALGTEFGYVSDETVAVGVHGEVLPHPKPLSLRDHPDSSFKRQVPASRLGLVPADGPLSLSRVLLVTREPHRAEVDVQPMDTVPALAHLVPHTSLLGTLERPLHRLADLLGATGGLHLVRYGEAETLRPLVRELLAAGR